MDGYINLNQRSDGKGRNEERKGQGATRQRGGAAPPVTMKVAVIGKGSS
jgi:hypothetical protein